MSVPPSPYDPRNQGSSPPPYGSAAPEHLEEPQGTPEPTPPVPPAPPVPPPAPGPAPAFGPPGPGPAFGGHPGPPPPAGFPPAGPPRSPKKHTTALVVSLVLGGIVVAAGIVGVLALRSGGSTSSAATSATPAPEESMFASPSPTPRAWSTDSTASPGLSIPRTFRLDQDITPGTCYDVVSVTFDLSDARVVDCEEPHRMEFVSTYRLAKQYTDQSDPRAQADRWSCWYDVIQPRVEHDPTLFSDSAALTWYPSAPQIAADQTTGYCVLVANTSQTGSDLLVGSLVADTYQGVVG